MNDQVIPRIAVSIEEASAISGVGRTTLYQALGVGGLPSLKVGRRRLVLVADLQGWLSAHLVAGPETRAMPMREG
jgi:excisionase family DNA binding protein